MSTYKWSEKLSGVWEAVLAPRPEFRLLDFAGASPREQAISELEVTELPFSVDALTVE